ncbi:B12-binding domain-containing radical SAM protein [Patescibacteria group bacterium]|nr:B12-binding domain-containing radical SAM protein [Patescibacteria group bacterium]
MNIALLTPPYDLMKQGYGSKRKVRGGLFPPLGLAYLASPLIKDGHKVKIIDASSYEYNNQEIGRMLSRFKPDIIGISSVTGAADASYSLANFLKFHFERVPIIYGGPHASCFGGIVFDNIKDLDLLVYGEGEITFKAIVDYYAQEKKMPQNLNGTWVKINGKLIKNLPAKPVYKLDDLLPPAYELIDYKKVYKPLPLQYKRLPTANMLTSRGCPYGKCTFCSEAGRSSQLYRRHSPERIIEEIKFLIKKQDVKEIAFWDDNFLISENWIFKFCDLLDKEEIRMPWSVVARVDTINRKMLERAKKSGLWNIFFGCETGNQDLLDRIKKGITLDQIRQAVRWCNELNIDTRGSFMLALPGETPVKALNTIEFACQIGLTYAQFLPTYLDWGTELYDDAIASGIVLPLYQGRTSITYVPNGYKDAKEVREMQKKAYREFYFRPSYIWKHFKRLKDFDKIKQYFDALMYILGIST